MSETQALPMPQSQKPLLPYETPEEKWVLRALNQMWFDVKSIRIYKLDNEAYGYRQKAAIAFIQSCYRGD